MNSCKHPRGSLRVKDDDSVVCSKCDQRVGEYRPSFVIRQPWVKREAKPWPKPSGRKK